MSIKRHILSGLFVATLGIAPAQAKDPLASPINAEILPGWQQKDGTRIAAIRFTLAQGWKTYWRTPGEGGIPPQFHWKGSRNLANVAITWPTPEVFHQNGMRTIGYEDELVLPLVIAPRRDGTPVKLVGKIDLGVCKDICMPETVHIKAVLDTASAKPVPAIAAALAARPYSGSEAGVRAVSCSVKPNQYGLEIEAKITLPKTGGREVVVIEPGSDQIWASETDATRQGSTLTARGDMMSLNGKPFALDRSAIKITVIGSRKAVEISGCTPG